MDDSSPTAAILSHWLRRSGSLPNGEITEVHIDLEHTTPISKLYFLTATYSSDAPSDLPRRFVVKSPLVKASGDGPEVQFYRDVAPSMLKTPPIVRCLAAIENSNGNPETIVIEDLRATHNHLPWPLPPSRSQAELAIDALAHVHAQYWEAPSLGNTIGVHNSEQSLTSMLQGVIEHLPPFFDEVGDSLTAGVRKLYDRVFASSLKPWMRLTDPRALTIIHGDAHSWNFLFPHSGSGPAYLIDWQLWHIDVGARDLAFLMALHWYPGRRRELEASLIQRYHEALLAHGIGNYLLDDLWLDYRRGVVRNLTIPIIFWSRGMKPEGWWHRLECARAAYDDLDCDELL
jgi:Ecdysteroid kinase-like family